MSATLYTFSGTGNSLWLARELAERIGDAEVVGVPSLRNRDRARPGGDVVGLVFPVYAWCPPRMVERFVAKVDVPPGAYVFALADADMMAGPALQRIEDRLRERGLDLAGGWVIRMPGNYPVLAGAQSEAKQQAKFAKARERLDAVADAVRMRRRGVGNRGGAPVAWTRGIFGRMRDRMLDHMDSRYFAEERCTGCGRCARICPTGNITLRDGRPVWGDDCEQCMACLQWCPVEAVQLTSVTKGRKRYHHPDITHEDILAINRPPDAADGAATPPADPT